MRTDYLLTQAVYQKTPFFIIQIRLCSPYSQNKKRTGKNIHKIKQLAWGLSKFIGTMVISDQSITLITPHCIT